MLRPQGYSRIEGGPEGLIEEDTVRCNHHQAIGFVQSGGKILWPQLSPVPQEQFTCRMCFAPICPRCASLPCDHFEKKLERIERRGGLRRLHLERMEELADKALRGMG